MPYSRALTIASSGLRRPVPGFQADLKAFAAAVLSRPQRDRPLTAQNTAAVTAIHELPPDFIRAAARRRLRGHRCRRGGRRGVLFSPRRSSRPWPDFLEGTACRWSSIPLMVASSGAQLLEDEAARGARRAPVPLATVVTPNQDEATRSSAPATDEQAERLVELGARAAIVTGGGQGDWLYDGALTLIGRRRSQARLTAPACTHSAVLAARLARGIHSARRRPTQLWPLQTQAKTASTTSGRARAPSTS